MDDQGLNDIELGMDGESLKQMFEAIPVPIVYARLDGFVFYRSDEFRNLLGYTDEDMPNEDAWWLLAYPDEQYRETVRSVWREELEAAVQENRKPRPQEWVVTCKDGSTKNIKFITAIIGDMILIIFSDVTEIRRIESELKAANTYLKALIDSSLLAIVVFAQDRTITIWNPAAEALYGWRAEEVIGRTAPYVPEDRIEAYNRLWNRTLKGRGFINEEARRLKKDGTSIEVIVSAMALTDENGNVIGTMSISSDITEKKRTEEALKHSEAFLNSVIEYSPISTWITDDKGFFIRQNQSCRDLFKTRDIDVIGKYNVLEDNILKEQGLIPVLRKVFENGETVRYTQWYDTSQLKTVKLKETVRLYVDVTISPVIGPNGMVTNAIGHQVDLTERKLVEDALKESESKYRSLYNSMRDAIGIVDQEGRIVEANQPFIDMLGYTFDELQHLDYYDLTPEKWHEVEDKILKEQLYKRGYTDVYEKEYRRKDGTVFPVEIRTFVRFDDAGNMIGLLGIVRDITERKLAEKALLWEKTLTDAILDSVPGLLYLYDEQGHFIRWNKRLEEETGYSESEISEASALDWPWAKESKQKAREAFDDVFKEGYGEVELDFFTKQGIKRHYIFTGVRLIIDDKLYVVGVGIDITERKHAEENLALTNAELTIVNRLISETAGIADLQSILDMAADEALKIVGLEGSTVCLIKPDDVFQLAAHRATSDQTITEIEQGVIRVGECLCGMCAKTGVPLILSTKEEVLEYATRESQRGEDIKFHAAFPLMAESKCVGVLCVFTRTDKKPSERNLKLLETASKQIAIAIERAKLFEEVKRNAEELEQRVSERTAQLESANKELEAFSYSVSHDLRAPLRAIDGFSMVILEDYADKLDEEGKGYLNRIRAAAVKMGVLIDDILRLSRVNRTEMVWTRVNLSEIARSIASDLMESQPERKVDFIIEPDLVVDADVNLIRVALENLIGNAWKFTSKKDVACIEFGSIKEKGKEIYYVRDNGVGFDQTYVDKLFVAFQRLHSDSEFPGTGIGLATVKRIIYRHGGETWAVGEVGKGATFYFTLEGRQNNASNGHSTC